jgi:hypothetical protein
VNRYIGHLQVVTANNYNSNHYFHTLQFTKAHSSVFSVYYYPFPVNGSNNAYSSACGSYLLFTGSCTELTLNYFKVKVKIIFSRSPLRPTTSNYIFQLNICGYTPYVVSCEYAWPFAKYPFRTYTILFQLTKF